MSDTSNINYMLGEINGKLDAVMAAQQSHDAKIEKLNARVGTLDAKAAKQGLVMGGIAAVGISLIKAKLGLPD